MEGLRDATCCIAGGGRPGLPPGEPGLDRFVERPYPRLDRGRAMVGDRAMDTAARP